MRRDRVVRLLAAGTLALTGTGCTQFRGAAAPERVGLTGTWRTAGCEFSRSPQHRMVGGIRMLVTPARLNAAMDRVERGGREHFPASFAGVEVDEIRVRAIVYRVPSAAFDDYVRYSAEDSCVVVRDAAHTRTELDTWHDRVVADLPYWTARGLRIVSVGSRNDGVGVEIGTRDFDRARRELPARYGPEAPLVFVEEGPIAPPASGRPVAPGTGG